VSPFALQASLFVGCRRRNAPHPLLDALVRMGIRYLFMPGLLFRKTATLVVAYSIALQVLLAGFVVGAHASFNSFAVICASNSAGDHNAPSQQHRDCSACPLACGDASSGVIPVSAKVSLAQFAKEVRLSAVRFETLPAPAKHQLQASRGPPIAG
jgi:hypothetical protein